MHDGKVLTPEQGQMPCSDLPKLCNVAGNMGIADLTEYAIQRLVQRWDKKDLGIDGEDADLDTRDFAREVVKPGHVVIFDDWCGPEGSVYLIQLD